jgi:hypothetical protein
MNWRCAEDCPAREGLIHHQCQPKPKEHLARHRAYGVDDIVDDGRPIGAVVQGLHVVVNANALNLSLGALKTAIHRLRGRFEALLREEVARTVGAPSEVDEELRYLQAALRS